MTPVPFDLPLRPSEAAQLAQLIFEQAERKPLTDEIRNRLAARAAVLRLESFVPWLGSLARDPVHPSSYYVAVDAAGGVPLLLHLATAAAPTSSIFPAALLIGRMRGPASEIVINAIPFGPYDEDNLEKFAGKVDTSFLPKPQGARSAVAAVTPDPARDLPAAFEAYRAVFKRSGRNLARLAAAPGGVPPREVYLSGLWSAIRAGWREGYSLSIEINAAETVRQAGAFTTFVLYVQDRESVPPFYQAIREMKSARPYGRSFEVEVGAHLASSLDWLKDRGMPCHLQGARLLGTAQDPDQIPRLSGTMSRTVT